MANQRVLVTVLAHPDDEAFAIGGTLAKCAADGVQVSLLTATRGEAARGGEDPARMAARREQEPRKAFRVLVDITVFREVKVRAMQCHASQEQPFPGNPETEAGCLHDREYFRLVWPTMAEPPVQDVFEGLP